MWDDFNWCECLLCKARWYFQNMRRLVPINPCRTLEGSCRDVPTWHYQHNCLGCPHTRRFWMADTTQLKPKESSPANIQSTVRQCQTLIEPSEEIAGFVSKVWTPLWGARGWVRDPHINQDLWDSIWLGQNAHVGDRDVEKFLELGHIQLPPSIDLAGDAGTQIKEPGNWTFNTNSSMRNILGKVNIKYSPMFH